MWPVPSLSPPSTPGQIATIRFEVNHLNDATRSFGKASSLALVLDCDVTSRSALLTGTAVCSLCTLLLNSGIQHIGSQDFNYMSAWPLLCALATYL